MALRTATRILLRDMTRADIREVRRIESRAYADAWPARTFETELNNRFARYRVAVERPVEDAPAEARAPSGPFAALRRLFGGRDRGAERIVGFMGVWYMVDQLHLVTIATAPDAQGSGLGQRLLEDCFDMALEAELPTVVLEVRVSNDRARGLYERYGFKRTGTLRAYYRDNNEDADVMLAGPLDEAARAHLDQLRAAHRARFGDHFE